jgi:6-phosphogluconolactonase
MSGSFPAGSLVYVGTYTTTGQPRGRAEGIYVCQFDAATGGLTLRHTTPDVVNPSFVALDPSGRYLYATNELEEVDGQPGGAVSAFAVDPATGALRPLNRQPSHGTAPCHLLTDNGSRYLFVANYSSGSVAVYPIQPDGSLGAASAVVQHAGSSLLRPRQAGPHAHSVNLDPANRFLLVCDLGLDQVIGYRTDLAGGTLPRNDGPVATVAPGSGPRHLAFHPNGRIVYVINEIGSTLTTFAYDAARGTLTEQQTVPTLPADFTGQSTTADVHVHPSGRFVYGSNRGHDSIAAFAVDPTTFTLRPIGHTPTGGQTPRNFAIDPSGTYLLAANQRSDTVVTFRIDQDTGALHPTGQVARIPSPVCLKFN